MARWFRELKIDEHYRSKAGKTLEVWRGARSSS